MVHIAVEDEGRAERFKRFGVLRDPGGRFPLVIFCPTTSADLSAPLERVEAGGTLLVEGSAGTSIYGDIALAMARGMQIGQLPPGSLADALQRLARRDVCESLAKVREESFPLAKAQLAMAQARTSGALQILVDNL